jgi:hypothetical protein
MVYFHTSMEDQILSVTDVIPTSHIHASTMLLLQI